MVVELDTSVTNEFTLAMIKPDAVASGSARDILHAIETNGFHIIGKKCIQVRTTPHTDLVSLLLPPSRTDLHGFVCRSFKVTHPQTFNPLSPFCSTPCS